MTDPNPPKPGEKKDTVRITLPPRPVPPSTAPAMQPVSQKETMSLKKATNKLPGSTKPAMPVVPPPTVQAPAMPMPQAPSTVQAAAMPSGPGATKASAPAFTGVPPTVSIPASDINRPTVKLQAADIPTKIPSPPSAVQTGVGPAISSGPTLIDAILSLCVAGVSAAVVWELTTLVSK